MGLQAVRRHHSTAESDISGARPLLEHVERAARERLYAGRDLRRARAAIVAHAGISKGARTLWRELQAGGTEDEGADRNFEMGIGS
jgi:hypothetical protein